MTTPQELVSRIDSLISLPHVALKVNSLLSDPDSSARDIAQVIEHDPALTARLLRLANSAMLSGGVEIATVDRAITRLGARQINELLLGIDTAQSFDKLPNSIVSFENYWRHCLFCAVISREIATLLRVKDSASAFSAGLLHDIGQLVMFSQIPDECGKILQLSLDETDGLELHKSEQETLGFDHTDVGLELARQWRLPKVLQDCIFGHHQPHKIEGSIPDLVWVIHIANSLAVMAELGSDNFEDAAEILDEAWQTLSLAPEQAKTLIADSKESVTEILKVFAPTV